MNSFKHMSNQYHIVLCMLIARVEFNRDDILEISNIDHDSKEFLDENIELHEEPLRFSVISLDTIIIINKIILRMIIF